MSTSSKTILITGATAGIGRMSALFLAKQGHHVIASGRKVDELAKLKAEASGLKLDTLVLDVTSANSIAEAVGEVSRLTGGHGLDVLVNNAGFGVLGPSSEISDSEMRRQYETNVFGLMAVTRAFIPQMRARRSGRIINVSSVGGRMTLPYFGVYNSTKYAVESLSDALRYELRPFGIDVTLIEPGIIRTNFEATAVTNLKQLADTPYSAALGKYEEMSKMANKWASDPIVIAKAINRAVRARRPSARYVAPFSTNFILVFKAIAPTRLWDWSMRKLGYLSPRVLDMTATPVVTHAPEARKPAPTTSATAPN